MPLPIIHYPENTTFGTRIRRAAAEAQAVALCVVDRFLGPGQSVFISDGSSTFFVALELYLRGHPINIDTNSLPVALEYPMWAAAREESGLESEPEHTCVNLAGGNLDRDLIMTWGSSVYDYASKAAGIVQNVVLSCKKLTGQRGPAGHELHSLRVKQSAIRNARRVIWVADHSKLESGPDSNDPLVYRRAEWEEAIADPDTYIVSTVHPGLDDPRKLLEHPPTHPGTPEEWYLCDRWRLKTVMKSRFVEVGRESEESVAEYEQQDDAEK